MFKMVGVIGSNSQTLQDSQALEFAFKLGQELAKNGYKIVCGGRGGIMEAVAKGAKSVSTKQKFDVLCLLPESDKSFANAYCDVVVPTGMGIMRNFLVARTADILIAISGGAGTMSEIAAAWQFGKKVLCVTGFGGWAEKLAGVDLDARNSGLLVPVTGIADVMEFLSREL